MEEASTLPAQLESTTKTGEELQGEGRQRLEEGRKRMETIQISALIFGIRGFDNSQSPDPATRSNPFAILGEDNAEAASLLETQGEMIKDWSFQGRKRPDPKQTPPRQCTQHPSLQSPLIELTPRGKRGSMHSEVHPSYFNSLGIQVPHGKEPLRARI